MNEKIRALITKLGLDGPRDRAWVIKTFFLLAVSGSIFACVFGGLTYWYFSRSLPKIITVDDYRPPIVSQVLGNNGDPNALLGEFYRTERRYVIQYDKFPDRLVRAFISAEDDQFFNHPGFNVMSMLRAALANFRAGHVVQGASTITQQVAKSLLLTSERSFVRKAKELILSTRMEHNLTKQQILYLYLNQIYLGHGAYGVEAAARIYFRKSVADLTLAECALLAGMPQAPGKYSPLLNPKRAKERQLYVLRRMMENKYITQSQMAEAAAMPVRVFHDENVNTKYAAYLVEHIRKYLVEKYGEKAVLEDGLTVSVPATRELSLIAQKSLREGLRSADKRGGYRGPIQHLETAEDVEKFLKEARVELVERKLHFQVLLPDGRIDPFEAMKQSGLQGENELLDVGELYRGVVIAPDDKKKSTRVLVGATEVELPLEKMSWAHTENMRGTLTPSKVLKKGDVILVKIESNPSSGAAPVVSLEQEPEVQGALFSIEAATGRVLAMEGGYDWEQSEFNRAIQAMRQPGSAFKPIIYAAALEKGYTPSSILVDSPIVYEDSETGKWKPNNFEEKFYGDTTFRQALIKSRNVPTIKIVQSIQVPYLIDYAKRLGMNSQFQSDLSISLGSATVSLMELTRVYALFPRLGRKVNPLFISKVVDRDGKVLEENSPEQLKPPHLAQFSPTPETPSASPSPGPLQAGAKVIVPPYPPQDDPDQLLDPRVAYVMTNLMKEVVAYGTGHDAKSLGRAAAGKTGTTSDYLDAWFMGFTPEVVTGVWVGKDNQKTIGTNETGARAALPIWLSFMREAVKGYPPETEFSVPQGVAFATIDPISGKLAAPNSPSAIKEAYLEGTQPTETAGETKVTPQIRSQFFKEDTE